MKSHNNDYEYWSKRAGIFDQASCDMDKKCSLDNKTHWVIKQFHDTDTTLELGCGTGIYSAIIASKVKSLIATDMSSEMLALARTKLEHYDNVEVKKEDCYDISYNDNTFDSVLLANLIHIVTDPHSVLKESRRVLKNDGRIIIVSHTFYGLSFFQKMMSVLHYIRKFGLPPSSAKNVSPESLSKLLEEAGFSVRESELMGDKLKTVCIVAQPSG